MNKKFYIKYKYLNYKSEYYFLVDFKIFIFDKFLADSKIYEEIKFDKIHNLGCKYIIEKCNE